MHMYTALQIVDVATGSVLKTLAGVGSDRIGFQGKMNAPSLSHSALIGFSRASASSSHLSLFLSLSRLQMSRAWLGQKRGHVKWQLDTCEEQSWA